MATVHSIDSTPANVTLDAPLRIPRFVMRLNEYAATRGIDVEVKVEPYSNDPEIRLWSKWRTTRERFLSLEFLTPSQHLPCKTGRFSVPMNTICALMTGDMTVAGDAVLWEIDFGPADFRIEDRGNVEIVTYDDETVYHGSIEALVGAGIDRRRLPLTKRPSKRSICYDQPQPEWRSQRLLDGSIVYRVESAKAVRARILYAEAVYREMRACLSRPYCTAPPVDSSQRKSFPPYLRLAVDNVGTVSRPRPANDVKEGDA